MIALCRGVLYQWLWGMSIGCYISDLYLANINNWIHSLLQKKKKKKKKKSKNIETETERVYSCYSRSPCSLNKYKYWKVRASPKLQF